MDKLTIEAADRDRDLGLIVQFQLNMAKETEGIELDPLTVEKGVSRVFADHSKGKYFVALVAEKVVASMLLTSEWSDWRNGDYQWIQSVYVIPDRRGQGVFREMYRFLKAELENDKVSVGLRLYVDKTNTPAQKVYHSLGMNNTHYEMFEFLPETSL